MYIIIYVCDNLAMCLQSRQNLQKIGPYSFEYCVGRKGFQSVKVVLTYCFGNKEKTRPFRDFEEEWVDLGKQFYLNVFEPGYIYLTLNDSVKFTKIKLQTFLIGDIQCNIFF